MKSILIVLYAWYGVVCVLNWKATLNTLFYNNCVILQHPFIDKYADRAYSIIKDLISRTKSVVREMDKRNARKIKKFLMEEFTDESNSLSESNGSLQNTDEISLPDESSQVRMHSITW